MPTTSHAALKALLAEYFRNHRKEFGYGVLTDDGGVREIIIFEPETFDVFRYEPESLTKVHLQHLGLPDGRRIPFPAAELLEQLRSRLE
jgi:hypothetical protein